MQPRRYNLTHGFTLIELLVVVGIIALLAGLVVSVSSRVMANANREQTLNNQKIILTAIERYGDVAKTIPAGISSGRAVPPPGNPNATDPLSPGPDAGNDIPAGLSPVPDFSSDPTPGYAKTGWLLLQYLAGNALAKADTSNLVPQKVAEIRRQTSEVLLKLPADSLDVANGFRDAWDKLMGYDCDGGLGGRPVIISAGPDGKFGTSDDVRSDDR